MGPNSNDLRVYKKVGVGWSGEMAQCALAEDTG